MARRHGSRLRGSGLSLNSGAFERTEVDAVAAYPENSLQVLIELYEAGPGSEIVAFVDPAIAVPEPTARFLIGHAIPAMMAVHTALSGIDGHLEPLTNHQIDELTR